jgi:hypothetical protein
VISKIEDHVERGLARLPSQFRDKPKLKAFLTVLMTPAQPLEDALWQLLTERDIDTAIGDQLDQIGVIVNQPRLGNDDDTYRRFLYVRIAINRSSGTPEELIRIAKLALADFDPRIEFVHQHNRTMVFRIRDAAITSGAAEVTIKFLNQGRRGGVRTILEWGESEPEDVFKFDNDTEALHLERDDSQYAAITDGAQTGLDVTGALTIESRVRFQNNDADPNHSFYTVASKFNTGQESYQATLYRPAEGTLRLLLNLSADGSANTEYYVDVSQLDFDEWYRVAFRFDPAAGSTIGDRTSIFVDGVELPQLATTGSAVASIFDGTADFRIGALGTGLSTWRGDIRDVKVWSRALTDEEIADGAASQTDLEGDWRLNGDYSDASGNDNTLTPANDPQFIMIGPGLDQGRFAGRE